MVPQLATAVDDAPPEPEPDGVLEPVDPDDEPEPDESAPPDVDDEADVDDEEDEVDDEPVSLAVEEDRLSVR